jgi:hypothetical protein
MRIGIVEATAMMLPACGGAPATTPTPAPNCSEFSWAFQSRGSDSLSAARFLADGAPKAIATTMTVLPASTPGVFDFSSR